MQQIEFKTQKTARVFTLGDVENATEVWIVLHGYAQLANTFIEEFECLLHPQTAIIAPEGFHRFYKRGFNGDVVASWMTKEDRLNDIMDYVTFLNRVYKQMVKPNQTVHVLGFSQGVATACRWIADGIVQPNNLILWAGTFPGDIDLEQGSANLKNTNIYLTYDNDDVFRTKESWEKQISLFTKMGINPTLFEYKGGHKIPQKQLIRFVETYINPSLSN